MKVVVQWLIKTSLFNMKVKSSSSHTCNLGYFHNIDLGYLSYLGYLISLIYMASLGKVGRYVNYLYYFGIN